jgi:hypothetical protein
MSYETPICEKMDGIYKITLNPPQRLNALGYPMETERP